MQIEILDRIVATEKRITRLKGEVPTDSSRIEEAKEYRRLLKLLGTTIAWILLEYNRSYIRRMSEGHDPGFIFGKKGLILETLALKAAFKNERAAVLHDLTNCLRIDDISVVDPDGITPYELKLKKKGTKKDRREMRQDRKRKTILENFTKGIKTKTIQISRIPDKHNFTAVSEVIGESIDDGVGIRLVEDCLVYCASKRDPVKEEMFPSIDRFLKSSFRDPLLHLGCHDRHICGLPKGFVAFPFTCFDIPISYKEKLLLGEVTFCVLLDIHSLRRVLQDKGFPCEIKDSEWGILQISRSFDGDRQTLQVGMGLIDRLLYECLSIETFINYLRELELPEIDDKTDFRMTKGGRDSDRSTDLIC